MKDAVGREIKVGDTVVYGDDVGDLHVAEVTGFSERRVQITFKRVGRYGPCTCEYHTSPNRVVVHNALKPEWNTSQEQPETD